METVWRILTLALVVIGTLFSIVGVLGLIRLPDVYTRLHAAGKVGVFGAALLAAAAALTAPSVLGKAIILIALLVIAGPVVSHALASAAYRMGIPLKRAVRDDLAAERDRRAALRDFLDHSV
ncbi:MAG: monovalent cation/H(+) antiporter subunit G [Thermoflexales bacterium]|nr:monovalent cation/H(+) antiporter subunit G [Thermoflexales bacterium]MDW8350833.1 monovalent cation/H(+) antiporter subunit G [Anaerolineae bacterium]